MNNRRYTLIGLTFLVVITIITTLLLSGVGSLLLTSRTTGFSSEELAFFKKFATTKDLLKKKYYKDITEQEIYDGAMAGMLDSLDDPYTSYLPVEENEMLTELTESKYDGLGLCVSMNENEKKVNVEYTLDNSPAEEAGILANDEIISINGTKCSEGKLQDAVNKMKCGAGTEITLLINRDGKEFEKKLVTREIIVKTVYSEEIEGYGYINITNFADSTGKEFEEKFNELEKKNVKGYVLDLRQNGGGIYDEAIKIAQILVPKGLIVYTETKDGTKEEKESTGEGIKKPLVVLIDEGSASASEILAGAIKDRKCGTLVGKKTFGKGLVQGWYVMKDGTSIKMTIAKYFTPNGICIDGIGIEPDVEAELNRKAHKDTQLEKALEILKE